MEPAQTSSVGTKFGRAFLLRCPSCGGGRLLGTWFKMRDHCRACGLALERGERSDFWIGAYVFNLALGEVVAIGIPIIWMIAAAPNQPWTRIEIVAIVLCIALPVVFFPFSRTLWLAWDLSFRPVEPGDLTGGASGDVSAPVRRHNSRR